MIYGNLSSHLFRLGIQADFDLLQLSSRPSKDNGDTRQREHTTGTLIRSQLARIGHAGAYGRMSRIRQSAAPAPNTKEVPEESPYTSLKFLAPRGR